jgi:hypothetical protein
MNKIDLIIDALEDMCGGRCNAEYNPCQARVALTAARELRDEPCPVCEKARRCIKVLFEHYGVKHEQD